MIYSVTGKVTRIGENTLVVDTGVVAFELTCSSFTANSLGTKTDVQTILTYLQVREDAMCLFGFENEREKMLFNDLMLVSGVGPKMAITILSGLPLDDIVRAIINSDLKLLSSIKGLGKKTAERIVLELNSKLGGSDALDSLVSGDMSSSSKLALPKEVEEAADVLISTGIQKTQAIEMAKANYKSGMTGEELVLECFKNLK